MRQQHESDDEAASDISHDHLQEGEIGVVSEAGYADDREGAGFGGNDGERDRPPGNIASSKKVVAQRALLLAEAKSEQSYADEIDGYDAEVDSVEAHVLASAYRGYGTDLMDCVEGYLGSDEAKSMSSIKRDVKKKLRPQPEARCFLEIQPTVILLR